MEQTYKEPETLEEWKQLAGMLKEIIWKRDLEIGQLKEETGMSRQQKKELEAKKELFRKRLPDMKTLAQEAEEYSWSEYRESEDILIYLELAYELGKAERYTDSNKIWPEDWRPMIKLEEGERHAVKVGKFKEDDIGEYKEGDAGGPSAEAGGGDCAQEGGQE